MMQHDMPEGDVLLHAGDFSVKGYPKEVSLFLDWLDGLNYTHKVVIAGNHDLSLDPMLNPNFQQVVDAVNEVDNVYYLNKESLEIEGIKIWGEPHQPEFFNWAFNTPRSEMKEHWNQVPEDTDILVTHGPPYGYRDLAQDMHATSWGPAEMVHVGCAAQKNMLLKSNIKHVVCGHIHRGYGSEQINNYDIMVHNASICNEKYIPANKPIVFDFEK